MPETKRPLKVFLCHARADKQKVRELHRYLRRRGIKPWFDEVDLVGGQDWQIEIPKALSTSDAIIICLTKNSVDKEGYIQKEIKFALDKALEMPEGRIFLIPVRFEECEVPFSLSRYQWVDLFDEAGYTRMMRALKFRASQLQRSTVNLPTKDNEEEKLALEKATREKEKHESAEKANREKIEREKAEQEAAEKFTREIAEREAAEEAVQEKAERERSENAAREKLERNPAEEAAREKVQQKAAEVVTREVSEQEAEEPSRTVAQEKAGNEQGENEEKTLPKVQLTPKQEVELRRQKPPRKLNRVIVIALIGLIGIICAVAISSPLLADLFTPQLTPTLTHAFTPIAPSNSPILTTTLTPTSFSKSPTPTSTQILPFAVPKDVGINCRYGPGVAWVLVSALNAGQTSHIVGKSLDGGWWYIIDPSNSSRRCWVSITITNTEGNLAIIPVVEAPKASVKNLKVNVDPNVVSCSGTIQPIKIKGTIEVNGPTLVQWYFETQQSGAMSAQTAEFEVFGTKDFSVDYTPPLTEGSYWVRLIVTSPNIIQDEIRYKIECS